MKANFEVKISDTDRLNFAELSGDYNKLHVDPQYSKKTNFGKPILHGAFHAGLISKMAGMYLPGEKCILYDIKVRFKNPLITPSTVIVYGKSVTDNGEIGVANVVIKDKKNGLIYAEGEYRFGRHKSNENLSPQKIINIPQYNNDNKSCTGKFLVTGGNGELGNKVCQIFGEKAVKISREDFTSENSEESGHSKLKKYNFKNIEGIIHCGWPPPVNQKILEIDNIKEELNVQMLNPIKDIIVLSKLMKIVGKKGAKIIIIGSAASKKGLHSWSDPIYSLTKSMIPNLVNILATELAPFSQSAIGLTFDVMPGGMNKNMSERQIAIAANRKINGKVTEFTEAAKYIEWILNNPNDLMSGSVIDLENTYRA